ncbi:MAG: large-conductance mechanosensitive channel protein MscL [Clostridia bacterium]|nr:large-conductance mechanosensitive channel protein MscL [Clostridia bacterium]
MKFFKEFKEFINKGNVVDMAVGVVIATAFGNITKSLVADIIMPLVGMLTGGVSVSDLKYVLTPAQFDAAGVETVAENAIRYGLFIQFIIDFLIIALAVFVFVKVLNSAKNLRNKEEVVEEAPAPESEPTKEEVLLAEIRDLLKEKK